MIADITFGQSLAIAVLTALAALAGGVVAALVQRGIANKQLQHEHTRWLRDRLADHTIEFLGGMRELRDMTGEHSHDDVSDIEACTRTVRQSLQAVLLFGSEPVRRAALEAADKHFALSRGAVEGTVDDETSAIRVAAINTSDAFARVARGELGVVEA